MAAATTEIYFKNGQKLSIYSNSSVVNSPLHCSLTGTAVFSSPYVFQVLSDTCIDDIISPVTAGVIEFLANNVPTGRKISLLDQFRIAYLRPNIPRMCFKAGVSYTIIPRVATS